MKNPNFIIIMSDNFDVECKKNMCSSNLGECVFKFAYTPNPNFFPSRISLFTGRYPSCHGVVTDNHYNNGDCGLCSTVDLLDLFSEKDYNTYIIKDNEFNVSKIDFNNPFFIYLNNQELSDKIFESLKKTKDMENTYFIFTSGGKYLSENPMSEKSCHIPMTWFGPFIKSDCINACVSLVDIYPTICELLGEEIPYGVQGRSLLPILLGEEYPEHEFDTAYSELGYGGLKVDSSCESGFMRMVRKENFKLIANTKGEFFLYDLSLDEENNLINNPEYKEVFSKMLFELSNAIMKAVDPLPITKARYRIKLDKHNYWNSKVAITNDPGVGGHPTAAFLYKEGKVAINAKGG